MKTDIKKQGVLSEIKGILTSHIRDYAMYIALAAIFIIFGFIFYLSAYLPQP